MGGQTVIGMRNCWVTMREQTKAKKAIDLFGYLDYRSFLKDWYQIEKATSPGFSYRVLARRVGYSSPGFFTQVLQRKSNISIDMAMRFSDALDLRKREKDYFVLLVRYDQESVPSERRKLFHRLAQFKDSAATQLRRDQDAFLGSWRHAAVRELLGIEPFQGGEDAWGARLRPPVAGALVRETLDLLLRLGLARRTAAGIERTEPCLETGSGYTEEATRAFMRQIHELGGEALDRFPRDQRHHGWATVSVSGTTLEAMRDELRALVQRFLAMAEKDDTPDRVMQLNLEFFPLAIREESSP